jgi:L-lactate dehydrogenase complex protein LldF
MKSSARVRFDDLSKRTMNDSLRKEAIGFRQDTRRTAQQAAAEELVDWSAWKQAVSDIRSHTVDHLDHYLEEFAANFERRGGKVFFAASAEEARAYVTGVARQGRVRLIVKSKSMLGEEIGLNRALESAGLEVIETDLGEFIIQLANETPFHILGPASHKTLSEIQVLFSQIGDAELPCDPKELAVFARKYLRNRFLTADMGICGCNFAVASEGSIVLVTSEGNGCLTSSLPPVLVVLLGMERFVPDMQSLETMLTVLPRAAHGVRATPYVSVITGPAPSAALGPPEVHVVIVDNGRSRILASDHRALLNCIRCGACLDNCPVYRHIGGHAYGPVYSGPIGAVLSPLLWGMDETSHLPFACSLCYACNDVCSSRIPLADIHLDLRTRVVEAGQEAVAWSLGFRAFSEASKHPRLWRRLLGIVRSAVRLTRAETVSLWSDPLHVWTRARDLPPIGPKTFRRQWRDRQPR